MTRRSFQVDGAGGFTIVETLLALFISGVTGSAAVMMLSGVSNAAVAERETRHSLIRRQLAAIRIGSELRSAAMALAANDSEALLWKGDIVGNGFPDLSELRLIAWSEESGEVTVYEMAEVDNDLTYSFDIDLFTAIKPLVGTSRFPGVLTLQDVVSWTLDFDAADIRSARRARVTASIGDAEGDAIVVITSFRADGGTAP